MSGTWMSVFLETSQAAVMKDTWGHMFPEPGSKHYGEIVVAYGEYGDQIIVSSDFPGLNCSPMRYDLEHSVFDLFEFEQGCVYRVSCGLWFYKDERKVGKIINAKIISKIYPWE